MQREKYAILVIENIFGSLMKGTVQSQHLQDCRYEFDNSTEGRAKDRDLKMQFYWNATRICLWKLLEFKQLVSTVWQVGLCTFGHVTSAEESCKIFWSNLMINHAVI